jgi:hypothetical protein
LIAAPGRPETADTTGDPEAATRADRVGVDRIEMETLLGQFAAMPGLSARFREERHLDLLEEPLVNRGVLYFAPPDRLLRRVEEPVESTLLVRAGQLTLRSAAGTRAIDLDVHPVVRAFVDSFRMLLAGDLEALRASYRIVWTTESADPSRWQMRLEPLGPPLRDAIVSIAVSGRRAVVRELRVAEVGGDETVSHFSEVDTERRFSEAELARIFRVPEP